jgi:hypothetical protein
MWGFDSSHFDVQYQGSLISEDTDHTKCKVIQEMENTYPLTGNDRISDYGFLTQNDIQNLISGTDCGALGFLWMGASNAWDGYIIYQVPKTASEKDLLISASFDSFGSAWWYLHATS